MLASLRSKVATETGEMEEPLAGEVQVLLSSKEDALSMRSLGVRCACLLLAYVLALLSCSNTLWCDEGSAFLQADYISKLVKVSGITIAASRTKAKATYVTLLCKNCRNVKMVPCRPGLGGAMVPRSCDHVAQVCSLDGCNFISFVWYLLGPFRSLHVSFSELLTARGGALPYWSLDCCPW